MTQFPIHGGCHCGAVRYSLYAPPERVVHCHCSVCRRLSMSFFQIGAVVRREDIEIERGSDDLTDYDSSPGFRRQFCRICGAPLFAFQVPDQGVLFFAPTSLDGGVHPGHSAVREAHVFVGSKAVWEHLDDRLPRYDASTPDWDGP